MAELPTFLIDGQDVPMSALRSFLTRLSNTASSALLTAIDGAAPYATLALAQAAPSVPPGTQARVYADSDVTKQGLYVNASGAVGGYALDTGFYSQLASVIQPLLKAGQLVSGFLTLTALQSFASQMSTGDATIVISADTGTHVAVSGEVALGGGAALVGAAIPNEGRYTKQASGALWRTSDTERQKTAALSTTAATIVAGIQGSVDTVSALSGLVTITDTVAGITPASGLGLGATTNAYANGLLPAGKLRKLEAYVATVGTGAIEFDVATFAGLSGFTRRRLMLNVSTSNEGSAAAGLKTWDQAAIEAANGGALLTIENSQVGVYITSGGAIVTRVAGSGFLNATGVPTEGASRTYATFGSFEVSVRATVRTITITVPQTSLDAQTQAAIKLAARGLKDTSAVYGLAAPIGAPSLAANTAVFGTETNRTVTTPAPMTEFRATINSVGDGRVMVLIANRSGAAFATRKKLIINLSASSIGANTGLAVWSQAAIEAANGGPVPLAVGDTVGMYSISGGAGIARGNTGDLNSAFAAGEPIIGTPTTYNVTTAGTPQYGFSTTSVELASTSLDAAGRAAIAEATKGARLRSRRTLLTDIAFTAAAQTDWTQTSGAWTQSAAGWQSPASPTAYTTALSYAPYRSNLRRRTMEWEIAPTTTATSVLFGWETFIQNMCSAVTVDWGAGLLRMKKSMTTGTSNAGFISEPGDFSTVAIPAAVPGRKYQVRLTVDERTNTYELWDTVTGLMLASLQDNVSGLLTYNQVTGGQFGRPVVRPLADQVTISRLRIIGNCRKGVELYIAGDSETDGQGLLVPSRWATLVGEDVGDYVVSARPGENSDIVDFLWTYEVSKILPKRVLLFLGINTQTINQAKFNTFIANCQAAGIEVAVCLCPPTTYGTPTAANAYLLGLDASIPKVRLDLALTTNNDGVTMNPAYFQADNLHVNTPAGPVVAARVKFDWDTLVGAS